MATFAQNKTTQFAHAVAANVFNGLAAAFGGHSQVPMDLYGKAILGHLINTSFGFAKTRIEAEDQIDEIVNHLDALLEEQWQDLWSETDSKNLKGHCWLVINPWLEGVSKEVYFG